MSAVEQAIRDRIVEIQLRLPMNRGALSAQADEAEKCNERLTALRADVEADEKALVELEAALEDQEGS